MKFLWQLLKKFWYIAAIIIIYLLIDLTGFIPGFGLFRSSAFKMFDTPVIVKEIREINQLVSSEFYGEVYGDLYQGYEKLYNEQLDTLTNANKLYNQYPGLKDYEKLKARINALMVQDSVYNARADSLVKQNNTKEVEEIQKKILEQKEQLKEAREALSDMKQERNLVYIGRGWVKAGFDFGNIKANDLQVEATGRDSVQLHIPPPEILDADINPWFIPDEVKGYEIFMHNANRQPFSDEEILLVKSICKEKLKQAALDKNILEKAKTSGETSLTSFFNLLDFEDVQVKIH